MDEDEYISKPLLVVIEALKPYPCTIGWCGNTYLDGAWSGGYCLCDECNYAKWIPIQNERDFLEHQGEFNMSLTEVHEFVEKYGWMSREASFDEHGARIFQREFNSLIGMG